MIVQSMVLVSSLSAALGYVSPTWISDLDNRIRLDLQGLDDWFFWWVMASAFVVVIGCAMEGPEIFHELWPEVFTVFSGRWVKKVGLVGWLFVVIGVAGEGVFEVLEYQAQGLLQTFNQTLLADAQRSAGSAKDSAEAASFAASNATDESGKATASALNAMAFASGATREADSFEKDIVYAKKQASDAESHLADALQRAAKAEAELNRIRSPRSLTDVPNLIAALKPLKGTEYTLSVFQDDESIQFLKVINGVLIAAGWIPKQPESVPLGISAMRVNDPNIKQPIPVCVDTGISMHTQSKESLKSLQSRPVRYLPKPMQAALALVAAFAPHISPLDERNVAKGILDPEPGDEIPVGICVGKKP